MIQITAKNELGESITIHVDKNVEVSINGESGGFPISITPSEWDLINQFVFDQTKKTKV